VKKAVKKEVEAVFFREVWMEVGISGMELEWWCDAVHVGKLNMRWSSTQHHQSSDVRPACAMLFSLFSSQKHRKIKFTNMYGVTQASKLHPNTSSNHYFHSHLPKKKRQTLLH
jgi:hypothetical protein